MTRDNNKDADALSNDAMDGNGWDGFLITAVGTHISPLFTLQPGRTL